MSIEFLDWGIPLTKEEVIERSTVLSNFANVCEEHPACEVLGFGLNESSDQFMVIVDIGDGTFELDNSPGILRIERIAVTYKPETDFHWEVRPLRNDFPLTLHQNHVREGEPRSLCLYMESWREVERSWTPESFLRRILWWLRSTADGTIHADDQPVEQLFFNSPISILLPRDHDDKSVDPAYRLVFELISPSGVEQKTLRGEYVPETEIKEKETPSCISISITTSPIENGPVEEYPTNLGSLQNLVSSRGVDLLEPLKSVIKERVGGSGLTAESSSKSPFILVILNVPRTKDGVFEKTERLGFGLKASLGELGEALKALFKSPTDNKWYIDERIPGGHVCESDDWRGVQLDVLSIQSFPSEKHIRTFSGLESEDTGPRGVIAGLGALGSSLAYLWAREAWGHWSYVDGDIIQAHNLTRHIATHHATGFSKTEVVRTLAQSIYPSITESDNSDYVGSIIDESSSLSSMLERSDVLIDVTTTLYVPRDLAENEAAPRVASVFFTPSGMASVLLLEDKHRAIRSTQLEAQYYRAILHEEWGAHHLDGHYGQFWVGAGCRDVSVALSNELVQLHASILARQVRKRLSQESAVACVWEYQDGTGGVIPHEIAIFDVRSVSVGGWTVTWDLGFERSIQAERRNNLPNETGGILLGIVDQKTQRISLVAWVEAPSDSKATPTSFERGHAGQAKVLENAQRKTAGIVTYVGEWHSHPPLCSSRPSADDKKLLASVSSSFQLDGVNPIMVIVADNSIGVCIDDDYNSVLL